MCDNANVCACVVGEAEGDKVRWNVACSLFCRMIGMGWSSFCAGSQQLCRVSLPRTQA